MSTQLPTASPNPPPSADELNALIDRLTDDQKAAVLEKLLPPYLMTVVSSRTVSDRDGRVLGYYIPAAMMPTDSPLFADSTPAVPSSLAAKNAATSDAATKHPAPATGEVASEVAPPGRRLKTVADGGTDITEIGAGD